MQACTAAPHSPARQETTHCSIPAPPTSVRPRHHPPQQCLPGTPRAAQAAALPLGCVLACARISKHFPAGLPRCNTASWPSCPRLDHARACGKLTVARPGVAHCACQHARPQCSGPLKCSAEHVCAAAAYRARRLAGSHAPRAYTGARVPGRLPAPAGGTPVSSAKPVAPSQAGRAGAGRADGAQMKCSWAHRRGWGSARRTRSIAGRASRQACMRGEGARARERAGSAQRALMRLR